MIEKIVAIILLVPLGLCLEVIFITLANDMIYDTTGYNLLECLIDKIRGDK